jgi:iron complex outermembrane receptor protein
LASADPATAFNPFTGGAPAPAGVLASIFTAQHNHYEGTTDVASGFVRGPIFHVPAGRAQLALGAEHYRDHLSINAPTQLIDLTVRRNSSSAFSEVRLPLMAGLGGMGSPEALALTAALRHDYSEEFGGTTTPQAGLEWRPLRSLLLRGSYSKAYRAPNLYQLYKPALIRPNITVADPLRDGQTTPATVIFSGTTALDAETGESHSFGIVWSDRDIPDLQMSATYWSINQTDRISSPSIPTLVANESLFPGRVVRGPAQSGQPGLIQSVDISYVNFGESRVSGVDLDVLYSGQTRFGQFSPSLKVVRTLKYEAALTPGVPATDRLSIANADGWAPRWKGAVTVGWKHRAYSAAVAGRYVGSYLDHQTGPAHELGGFWLCDMNFRYELGEALASSRSRFHSLYVTLGAINVFDELPEYSNYGPGVGYDPFQYDIRGRFSYLKLGMTW